MTEMIEYNTILKVTDDEGAIHLLVNLRYTVIVIEAHTLHSKYATFNDPFIL